MIRPKEFIFVKKLLPQLFQIVRRRLRVGLVRGQLKKDKESGVESPVTEIDIKIDRFITKAIKDHFPDDNILSEESGGKVKRSGRLWVIDPICGTGNFASGIKFFSTNIALFEEDKPIFATVVDYSKETFYWAHHRFNGLYEKEKRTKPVFILDNKDRINIEQAFFFGRSKKMIHVYGNIVREIIQKDMRVIKMDSSLSFTYAALAKYGAFIVFQVYPWDFVSHCFLIEKNGGVATDFVGKRWSLSSKNIVASLDKDIHKKLVGIIKKYWPYEFRNKRYSQRHCQ